jgi:glycosyltransferase involved in cell wall biosynthesis
MVTGIIWVGPVFDRGGYGAVSRNYLKGLHRLEVPLRVVNIGEIHAEIEQPMAQLLRELCDADVGPNPALIIHGEPSLFSLADRFQPLNVARRIGCTIFETDRIPPTWVDACHRMDEVWVPSHFNRETFASSGVCRSKLRVIPYGVDTQFFTPDNPAVRPFRFDSWVNQFKFLYTFAYDYRKGVDLLLEAYLSEFSCRDNVALVLKTYLPPYWTQHSSDAALDLKTELQRAVMGRVDWFRHDLPQVVLLDHPFDQEDLLGLYLACDAYISTDRANGWGMPCQEMMALGKPTATIHWSGSTEFMNEDNSFLIHPTGRLIPVDERLQQSRPLYRGHMWAEVTVEEVRRVLRFIFENRDTRERIAAKGLQDIRSRYTVEHMAQHIIDALTCPRRRAASLDRVSKEAPSPQETPWDTPQHPAEPSHLPQITHRDGNDAGGCRSAWDNTRHRDGQNPLQQSPSAGSSSGLGMCLERTETSSPLHLTYEAPLLDMSGYAVMARSVVLGLEALGVDLTVKPMWTAGVGALYKRESHGIEQACQGAKQFTSSDGKTLYAAFRQGVQGQSHSVFLRGDDGGLYEYRTSVEADRVERLLKLAVKPTSRKDIYLIHMLPATQGINCYFLHRWRNQGYGYYIGSTMFETVGLPWGWAEACNGMDEVWVPSQFNRETFSDAGVRPEKIQVLPLGIDPAKYDPTTVMPLEIASRRGFTFLSTFQWTKRKGWDILLKAYLQAFSPRDEVTLVLRAYYGGGESVAARLQAYITSLGYDPTDIPDIVLLEEHIPDGLMPALYAACDAFVLPSRGEGWGLPYMEAMAMGKPTIGTRWGGNLEFMTEENAFLIDIDGLRQVDGEQVADNPLYHGQRWAEPSLQKTAALLRYVFEHPEEAQLRGKRAREDILAKWTLQHQARRIKQRLEDIDSSLSSSKPVARPSISSGQRPLRILFQNRPNASSQPGGDTVVMKRLRERLGRLGVQVDVALGPSPLSSYDVVHLFNFATPQLTERYAREAVEARVPFVVTTLYEDWPRFLASSEATFEIFRQYVDGGRDERLFQENLQRLRVLPSFQKAENAYTARHAACLLACSLSEKERLLRDYPDARRIEVVKFGSDHAKSIDADPELFCGQYGVKDYVLCVGRLETRKNQLMLLKALERDEIPIVFITGGFTYQQSYAELCRRFQRLGKTLFVERVADAMLISAYKGARVLCMPSWYELPGLVALEAARCGCPIVASSWGVLEEYLGQAVWYCEPDHPTSIRQAILRAYSSPVPTCLQEKANELTWDRAAQQLLTIYQKLARVVRH